MSRINDLNNKSLSIEEKKAIEKITQSDELNYLSSIAFEQFNVNDNEINKLNDLLDKRKGYKPNQFNTIFISLLSGLLIGISVFFAIFQNNKIHLSINQRIPDIQMNIPNNTITKKDTVVEVDLQSEVLKKKEHFVINDVISIDEENDETIDILPIKKLSLDSLRFDNNMEVIIKFIPNAPVVFISNMKVANYKLYYFKRNVGINLANNIGVSAQYENKSVIEKIDMNRNSSYYDYNLFIEKEDVNRNSSFFAHKIVQFAMGFFDNKNYINCIEELIKLYNYNKNDANAQFYLGLCYYQLGKYERAKTFFNQNLDNLTNIFHQESEFYNAICLLKTNQMELGNSILERIILNKGFYAERAKLVLNK